MLLQQGADPFHKLKDNSTMLIEAAKGGHTTVVQMLIDYPNSLVTPSVVEQVRTEETRQCTLMNINMTINIHTGL